MGSHAWLTRPGEVDQGISDDVESVIGRLRKRLRRQGGFTLVELMIVVNIMGTLSMMALPSYMNLERRATDNAAKANLGTALNSVEAYFQEHNSYAGMTLPGLLAYDQALDQSMFTLAGVTATTYCIQSPQGTGSRVWRKNGPAANYELNHC